MISLKEVIFDFERDRYNFNLDLEKGDKLALIGSSGAGKSTLLNLIAGFYKPNAGNIIIDNQDMTDMPPNLRPITIMFQEHNLFPHLTVEQNIAIGISSNLKLKEDEIVKLQNVVSKLGLNKLEAQYPAQLSGGQRQRVALARCILRKKSLLLLDEPFTALDPALRKEMLLLLDELHKEQKTTIIIATHYPEDLHSLCNKTAFLFENSIYKLDNTKEIFEMNQDYVIQKFLGKKDTYAKE
jgi:thiamine transport system ATP-binding protein